MHPIIELAECLFYEAKFPNGQMSSSAEINVPGFLPGISRNFFQGQSLLLCQLFYLFWALKSVCVCGGGGTASALPLPCGGKPGSSPNGVLKPDNFCFPFI